MDVTIEPIGYNKTVIGDGKTGIVLLDLHFDDVVSVTLDYSDYGYIHELVITTENGFLVVSFDSYFLEVGAKKLTINKPRFVRKDNM